MSLPQEARPFVSSEMDISKIKTMSDSDSSESGGEGSCSGDSACSCPSSYLPVEGRMNRVESGK